MAEAESLENQQWTEDELKQMGRLYGTLVKNPKTRETALRMTKFVAPETSIPEIDVLDRVTAGVKPINERLTKTEEKLLAADTRNGILEKRQVLMDKGYTKDDVAAMEKIMTEKHIPSYETAAEFYDNQRRAAPVTPANYIGRPTLPIDREKTKLAGGYKKFFQQDAHAALDDLRSGKIKLNS